ERYAGHFGPEWVVTREAEGHTQVRLRTFDEYRNLLAEEGEFLLIRSEEITERYEGRPIHVNATNIRDFIPPQGGNSVLEVMQNNVDAVLEQRKRTGQDMFPHLNHPNYEYAISLADFIALEGDRFFEVYNGHPLVNNHGDHDHPGTETMWDFALSHRLVDGRGVLYGLATDDAHKYHESSPKHANPGRGWVMVRAESLETDAIIAALEAGDFYASSGVTLSDVQVSEDSIWIEIQPDSGVTYTTQFVGTSRDFDPSNITASTRIGRVLSEVEGTTASYRFRGDELYVRARIISSRAKKNGLTPDEREMAWVQPVPRVTPEN
ncbi:MAG TPA: hypothetical protein VF190_10625, partial [Rhodothermales bacterium]